MKRNGFRACTEPNGFTVPGDLQHLSAGTASPLLPRFSFLEEQGYFPVTVDLPPLQASSGVHNSSLISMTIVTINKIVLGKSLYSFQIIFFNTCYLLKELSELQECFKD